MGYRLARWALVLGYQDLAASLLRRLVPKVQSTSTRSWMEALVLVAEAEDQLCAAAVASGGAGAARHGGIARAVSKLHQVCVMPMARAISCAVMKSRAFVTRISHQLLPVKAVTSPSSPKSGSPTRRASPR